jgi:hypothetical protein
MILNIKPGTFGGPARVGDIVGICNIIQYLRNNHPELKFFMQPGTINEAPHCQQFFSYMKENTNYFAENVGMQELTWNRVNVWDFRAICGDLVSIPNEEKVTNKVVMFPLFDAPYNTYRNWPKEVFFEKIEKYFVNYPEWERVICITDEKMLPPGDYSNYTISTNFLDNLQHIKTCRRFIGGDTGTSHFAWSLVGGPESLRYVMSNRGLMHTMPFHMLGGKGKLESYWLDFEGTRWN